MADNVCLHCGGKVRYNERTRTWTHDREVDWLSGGAHPVLR